MNVPFTLIIVIFLVMVMALCSYADQADSSFNPPTNFFPIMPWDSLDHTDKSNKENKAILTSVAECNFTLSPYALPVDLPIIEKLGLKAVMQPPKDQQPWKSNWSNMPVESVDEIIKRFIQSCGKSDTIFAYYINDEPGTPKFPALGEAVKAVEKYAPGKLAYINILPGYATIGAPNKSQLGAESFSDYLEQYVQKVKPQIISYDNYVVETSDDFQHAPSIMAYFRDLIEVRRVSLKYDIPFWNVVSSNQIRPYATIPSLANLLVQAYTTLAAGGRGIAWYNYQHGYAYRPLDNAKNRTDTWYYLRMVNGQVKTLGPIMNRIKSTGLYFSEKWPSDAVPQLPGRVVGSITSRSSIRGFNDFKPPLMIGEFTGEDGCDYVMVVNLSLEKSANFILHTKKEYSCKEVFSASNGTLSPFDETNGQWLVAGQGVLIKLSME